DGAELVERDTFVAQGSAIEARFDDAISIGPGQLTLRGQPLFDAFLHPLQMVRLQEQAFLPMNLYGHSSLANAAREKYFRFFGDGLLDLMLDRRLGGMF